MKKLTEERRQRDKNPKIQRDKEKKKERDRNMKYADIEMKREEDGDRERSPHEKNEYRHTLRTDKVC